MASRESIVQDGVGLCSIKQDIWDEDGAHAHAEARDNRECAAKRFAQRSAGGEGWRRGGWADSRRQRGREGKILLACLSTDPSAGQREGERSI
jgi:hypothetical protein